MRPFLIIAFGAALATTMDGHAQLVHKAEYFFDTDPGVGNGIPIPIAAGDPVTFAANISTSGLGPGLHYLFLRTRTENYKWSLSEPRLFEVASVAKAEYFFDTDPGAGNGIPISFTSGNLNYNNSIDISGLPDGPHYMFIRTRQGTGRWSIPEPRYFYILTRIMTAEYFIDTDPGAGNATQLGVGTPSSIVTFAPTITIGALVDGQHHLIIRTKDALGIWSMFEPLPFTVDQALPIELVTFEATALNANHVRLNWRTETEVNNDFFTVQHSLDGKEFKDLLKVPGAGTSTVVKDYETFHVDPPGGRNYYRLEQTDYDGSVTFTPIVFADVSEKGSTILYPNPARQDWYAAYEETGTHRVEVYDMLGRKCLDAINNGESRNRFIVDNMSAGTYMVRITSQTGTVVTRKLVIEW